MKTILTFLACLMLSSCVTRGKVITKDSFADMALGSSTSELVEAFGKPYNIYARNGCETYEYMEKFFMGRDIIEQRRYYFVIKDNEVVEKYLKITNPPPFSEIYSDDPYVNY